MKLLKKWWWIGLIVAVALVIGWEEKRCQTHAYECRANYAAQERVLGSVSPYQQATEDQAIAAACEPNGFFCRFLGPANLPTMLLVFIGLGGIWAAMRTLWAIEAQAESNSKEVKLLNRAYLGIHAWMCNQPFPGKVQISFGIYNPGRTGARIRKIEFSFRGIDEVWNVSRMLTPRESCRYEATPQDLGADADKWNSETITGRITYTDIFRQERHRKFGAIFERGMVRESWENNDEEEWDEDQQPGN